MTHDPHRVAGRRAPLEPKRDVSGVVVARVAGPRRAPLDEGAGLLPGDIGREPNLVEELVVRSPLGAVPVRPRFRPRLVGIVRRIRAACLVRISEGVHVRADESELASRLRLEPVELDA